MSNSLQNIILHDSYFRHKRSKLPCFGHTNNTGDNGAGKTSMLQLIPVFYGYLPEKLMTRAAGKESFLDFYLPYVHSMIVFEYQRAGQLCCVVLYRHATTPNKLIYRFVKGAADDTLFTEFTKEHFEQNKPTTELFKLFGNHIEHSIQISTTKEYAAIIGKQIKNLPKNLVRYAHDYALCGEGFNKSMMHMGELTSVLLNSDQLLERLRTMLSTLLVGEHSLGKKPELSANRHLPATIVSLQALEGQKHQLQQSIEANAALKQIYHTLKNQQQYLLSFQETLMHEINALDIKKQTLQHHHNQYLKAFDEQLNQLHQQISQTKGDFDDIQRRLVSLEKNYDKYQQKNIIEKIQQWNHLAYYETQFKQSQQQLKSLTGNQHAITQEHQANCRRIEQQTQEALDALNVPLKQAQITLDTARVQKEQAIDALNSEERSALETLNQTQNTKLRHDERQLAQAEQACAFAKQPTPDEAQSLKVLDEKLTAIQEHMTALDGDGESVRLTMDALDKTLSRKQQSLQNTEEQYQSKHGQEMQIRALLSPEDGSLLAFLRQEYPDWTDNIGRVIDPNLLLRRDLQPVLQRNGETLYGVALHTAHLPLPIEAEKETKLHQRLYQAQTEKEILAKRVSDEQKAVKAIQEDLQITKAKLKQIQQRKERYKAQLKDWQAQKHTLICQHEQNACERLAAKQKALADIKAHYENTLQIHAQEKQELLDKFAQKRSLLQAQFKEAEDEFFKMDAHLKQERLQLIENKNQNLALQENAYQTLLTKAQVDAQTLQTAQNAMQLAQQKYQEVSTYGKLVREYQSWHEHEFSQRQTWQNEEEALEERLQTLQKDKCRLQAEFDDKEAHHQTQQETLTAQKQQLADKKETLQTFAKRLQEVFVSWGEYTPALPVSDEIQDVWQAYHFEMFCQSLERHLAEFDAQTCTLKKAIQEALVALQSGEMAQVWQQRMSSYQHLLLHTLPYYLAASEQIADMLAYDIPQKQRSSLENFRAIASTISDYYDKLRQFDKAVGRLSDELSSTINQQHGFGALSDIQIRLTSVLQDEYLLKQLKPFYDIWQDIMHQECLPNQEALNEFEKALLLLNNSQITTEDPRSLIHLALSCKEQGRDVVIKTQADLKRSSSTGISTLLIVVLFASLSRYLCQDEQTVIHWPLDELGTLSDANILRLFEFMDKQNIRLFCAQPKLDMVLSNRFECKNDIDRTHGIRHYKPQMVLPNPLLSADVGI